MKFIDKKTPGGEAEVYTVKDSETCSVHETDSHLGEEVTGRFVVVVETRKELEATQAALVNLALSAFESPTPLSHEDSKMLIDYLRSSDFRQGNLTVYPKQATRLARLIRLGAGSVTSDIIKSQFDPPANSHDDNAEAVFMNDDELTDTAIELADALEEEALARLLRQELNDATGVEFFDE